MYRWTSACVSWWHRCSRKSRRRRTGRSTWRCWRDGAIRAGAMASGSAFAAWRMCRTGSWCARYRELPSSVRLRPCAGTRLQLCPTLVSSKLMIKATGLLLLLAMGLSAAPAREPQSDSRLRKSFRRPDQNGWTFVHLEGTPSEIGFQHGYLLSAEIEDTHRV